MESYKSVLERHPCVYCINFIELFVQLVCSGTANVTVARSSLWTVLCVKILSLPLLFLYHIWLLLQNSCFTDFQVYFSASMKKKETIELYQSISNYLCNFQNNLTEDDLREQIKTTWYGSEKL